MYIIIKKQKFLDFTTNSYNPEERFKNPTVCLYAGKSNGKILKHKNGQYSLQIGSFIYPLKDSTFIKDFMLTEGTRNIEVIKNKYTIGGKRMMDS